MVRLRWVGRACVHCAVMVIDQIDAHFNGAVWGVSYVSPLVTVVGLSNIRDILKVTWERRETASGRSGVQTAPLQRRP